MWDINTLIPLNKQYEEKLRAENAEDCPQTEQEDFPDIDLEPQDYDED